MSYQNTLTQIKSKIQSSVDKKDEINQELEAEIEKLKKQFEARLSSESKIEQEGRQELTQYCNKIAKHSTFDVDVLGPILASLISIYEGTLFSYQATVYHTESVQNLAFDHMVEPVTKHSMIIVESGYERPTYHDDGEDSLKALIRNRKALLLQEDRYPRITLCAATTDNVSWHVHLKEFPYVREFLEEAITYQMEQESTISKTELEKLKLGFLKSRVEDIKKNYDKRNAQEREALEEQLDKTQKARQYQLESLLKSS